MKAIRIHSFGGPEVLVYEDIPLPQPGPGELCVRVIAAGVNPADWKMRKGMRQISLPFTPGLDVAGVVDTVGTDVDAFRPGEAVFAKLSQGGYAEYAVMNASQAAVKPASIGFVESAAVPTAGLTAWQALFDTAGLEKGQSVLIHGAAGGVGSFAVQLARWKGARVVGTASGNHLPFVKSLGADKVIDYTIQRFEEVVQNVDVVLDTVGEDTFDRSWRVLKPGGTLVTLVARIPEGAPEAHGVHAAAIVTTNDGQELAHLATLIDEGHIKPMVTTVLPLSEARKAHEMIESRHTQGKIVLRIGD